MTVKKTAAHSATTAHPTKKEVAAAEVTTDEAAHEATPAAAAATPASVTSTPKAGATGGLTEAQVQQAIGDLNTIAAILGAVAQPMTIEERRAQPKMKKGGDKQMPDILTLADQYKVSIPGGGTAEARADIALVALLQPLVARLASVLQLAEDAILQADGRAWEIATTLYAMLLRLVKRFPALQGELQPMASFMARKHKDAPTNLRKAEAATLKRARATRKETKAKETGAAAAPETAAAVPAANGAGAANGVNGAGAQASAAPAVVTANRAS